MDSLTDLTRISEKKRQGPSPTFNLAHLLLAFLTVGEGGPIGRQTLASRAGLGEGAIRTVLKKLREDGYVDANASGCHLTAAGQRAYKSVRKRLSPMTSIKGSKLTVGVSQVALAVRGSGRVVKTGIEQRDSAIRAGATGATTYVIRENKFTIPGGSSNCEKDFPGQAWDRLRRDLAPKNGDVVIVCGSPNETSAKVGALSAALTLL